MIRLFVLIGIVGGAAITYLATYGVGPEAQLPPAVSQLDKFRAAGLIPEANAVTENEELEHGIFDVPPEDEVQLEQALANAPAMDMGGGAMDMGATGSGTMDMSGTGGTTTEMPAAESGAMEMPSAESGTMEMPAAENGTMEMAGTESGAMEKEHDEMEMAEGGLLISEDGAFDREIVLTMSEWMFSNMQIDVKMGERIKFTVRNGGKIPHEFMFMTMPAMAAINYRAIRADWSLLEHEALYEQSLVLPGGDFSLVVQVQQPGSWMFMCMLPYHMQMGMMGQMATPGMAMDMQM